VLCCRCRALASYPFSLWKQCDAQREDSWVMMQMARGDRQLFLSYVLRNACRSQSTGWGFVIVFFAFLSEANKLESEEVN